jgi:iron complex outermembrane receptor protein
MTARLCALRFGASAMAMAIATFASPALYGQALPPASSMQNQAASPSAPQPAADGQPVSAEQAAAAPADAAQTPDIVVTGTSLRGVAPVGANLVSIGRDAIENTGAQTLQQILRTVPQLTGLGSTSQGQNAGSAYYSINIHQLGSSASNSTLTLIDGHRLPIGGTNHPLPDPNIVPPIAIERVEVLAEGASSTYGSDAVAGVVNFITRRKFDGIEATAQTGFGKSGYRTYNAGVIVGSRWGSGGFWIAYNYSNLDAISGTAGGRDFLQPNHIDQGGTNFQSFNCAPATIQPAGSSGIYLSPTATSPVANITANAPCDPTVYSDLVPSETRHTAMARIDQEVGDRLTLSADMIYSNRRTFQNIARGGIAATVFQTGAQANPFYINPPGVTATSQTIRFQADDLLGPGAYSDSGAKDYVVTGNAEYRLNDNFRITLMLNANEDDTYQITSGMLCTSCAALALNGTTNTGGSLTTPSIPGTSVIITNLPLTSANALDVWHTGSGNLTSPAVLAQLVDSRTPTFITITMKQARLGLDGTLFKLPAGPVKVAVGGEIVTYHYDATVTRPNNTGPASTGSSTSNYVLDRNVKSAFAELLVPVVSPEMGVPLVQRFDISVSGRYDHYPVFGSTTNPKIGANWEVTDGLKLRANWSRSFVAPALTSFGDAQGAYAASGYSATTENIQIPVAAFPGVIGLPGCPAGSTVCSIGGNIQGVRVLSGNHGLKPETGTNWSVGIDFAPRFAPGFRASATLFNAKFTGGITSPNLSADVNSSALNPLLTFYPNGATASQIAAATVGVPQTGNLPSTVYFIQDFRQYNVLNLDIQGLDLQASYKMTTAGAGTFTVGASGTRFLRYRQNFAGGQTFDVLNTTGFNQTFPSIEFQGRADLGWEYGPVSIDLFANHVSSYRNWSSSTVTPVTVVAGIPTGGGDHVSPYTTFDGHISWRFSHGGALGNSELYVDGTNIFDRPPPFYNSATGYDPYGGSPIGRVVSIGLRVKY